MCDHVIGLTNSVLPRYTMISKVKHLLRLYGEGQIRVLKSLQRNNP